VIQSTKRITAVAVAAAVVVLLIWYVALFRPQSRHLSAAHKAHAAAEALVQQRQQQIGELQSLVHQIPADDAKLSTLNAAVPTTPDLKDILDQLHGLATSTGCELTAVNPAPPATPGTSTSGPQSIQVMMSVSGGYSQLMAFLTGLNHIPRTVVVDSASIGSSSAGLQAQLTARIFYSA
jgi:Tfp pilus assembly protein PilO